jgi:hypothetical protein
MPDAVGLIRAKRVSLAGELVDARLTHYTSPLHGVWIVSKSTRRNLS